VSLDAEDIRNEKVKVLRSMKMISMDDVVLGQYRGRKTANSKLPGYLDDDTVPEGRRNPPHLPFFPSLLHCRGETLYPGNRITPINYLRCSHRRAAIVAPPPPPSCSACTMSECCNPPCSLCPTFAAVGAFIQNARWDDVPFLLKAGKALHSKRAEIRVQFRHVPGNLYRDKLGIDLDRSTNELVTITPPPPPPPPTPQMTQAVHPFFPKP